jgi:hypothetical protein
MSVVDLVESLKSVGEGEEIDFQAIRKQIIEEYDKATSISDRVTLLELFKVVMDLVERNIEHSGSTTKILEDFRKSRQTDYRVLIVKECMVGENVCTETLAAVTQREVAAGRMSEDHTLYTMAQEQVAKPHLSRAELVAIAAKKGATAALVKPPETGWWRALGIFRRD